MEHKALQEIRHLDPTNDYERIVHLINCYEFPFDTTSASEFALFRSFAVPSISALLAQTGEFRRDAQKRYDDTDLILSQGQEKGFNSQDSRAAFRRMNQMHRLYSTITNDEFLYVLSTFVYEPIRWNARFGWRPMIEQEKLGLFYYGLEAGRRMNIKSLPKTIEEFEEFNIEYEKSNFRYADSNREIADATCNLFLGWFLPKPLQSYGKPFLYAMMDEPLLSAFGYPKPSNALRKFVENNLRLRAKLVSLLPERSKPKLRTKMKRRSYPHGFTVEQLGIFPVGNGTS